MNKHILLVMKYLDDNNSVTQEELLGNYKAAAAAYVDVDAAYANAIAYVDAAYVDAAYANAIADAAYVDAAYAAAHTAHAAAHAAAIIADINYTKKKVDEYFDFTGENRQDYVDALSPTIESPVYTQAMKDAGELPSVGMRCTYDTTFFSLEKSNRGVCTPIAYFENKAWLNMYSTEYVINLDVITFKPLTPPKSDIEMAFEDMEHELEAEGIDGYDSIMLRILIEKFKGNKIRGVTFTGDK